MRISDWSSDVCSSDLTADRTFGIDVALYHIDWKDIQTFDLSSPFGGYINGPRAKIDGGEIALTARPAAGLVFSGNLAVQDARLAEDDANFGASKGDPLPNVPRYSVSLSGDRSEEHTSELQSLLRIPYAVFC